MAVGSFLVTDRALRAPRRAQAAGEPALGAERWHPRDRVTWGARGLTLPGALEEQTLVCPGTAALSQVHGSLQAGSSGVCLI